MADNKLSKKDNIIQVVKFVLFSASAGIIQFGSFTLLTLFMPTVQGNNAFTKWFFESDFGAYYIVSLILSVLWNFTVNRKFTFKSATNVPIAMLKVFGYYCVFAPITAIVGEIITPKIPFAFGEFLVEAGMMLTNLITEFLFCRFVVYKDSMNTNESAKKGK